MPVDYKINSEKDEVSISISGQFDYDMHMDFKKLLDAAQVKNHKKYVIDMGAVEDMDSSALGMLLLLRENAGGDEAHIEITKLRPDIREILAVANFDKLFRIN